MKQMKYYLEKLFGKHACYTFSRPQVIKALKETIFSFS